MKFKDIKDNIESIGFKFVEEYDYNDNFKIKTKFKLINNIGYLFFVSYDMLKYNPDPGIVGTYNPFSINNIKNWLLINKKPYKLISTEYVSSHDLLTFECDKHGQFSMNWTNMQQGQKCPQCHYANLSNKFRLSISYIKNRLLELGIELLSDEYVNESTELKCKCLLCGREFKSSWENMRQKVDSSIKWCKRCSNKRQDGHHFNWKGGITPLHNHLRYIIKDWKMDSFKNNYYKCCITGKTDNLIIHHLYGFNNIIQETINILNLNIEENINNYSEEDLKRIEDKCIELHYKYGLGVCLTKCVHDRFHDMYGKGNNTEFQFNDFKEKINKGEIII